MRIRRIGGLVLALALIGAGCGDDDSGSVFTLAPGDGSTTVATDTPASSVVADGSTTSAATPATSTTAAASTSAALPTAADSLAAFFAAAADLDARIRAAAALFNAGFDQTAGSVSVEAATAINLLDARPLVPLISPGISLDLETAVLAVYADLDSRIAALQGATRVLNEYNDDVQWALDCLGYGGDSASRYPGDMDRAQLLATLEPPPNAAPDSVPAGVLAVRAATIHSMDFGCDSCGGVAYTAPIQIRWDQRLIGDGDGVGFEATFNGTSWEILIYAC